MASCPPFLHPTTAEHDNQAQNGLTSTIPPTHHFAKEDHRLKVAPYPPFIQVSTHNLCRARSQTQWPNVHHSFNSQPLHCRAIPLWHQAQSVSLSPTTHNPCTSCRAKPLGIRLSVSTIPSSSTHNPCRARPLGSTGPHGEELCQQQKPTQKPVKKDQCLKLTVCAAWTVE